MNSTLKGYTGFKIITAVTQMINSVVNATNGGWIPVMQRWAIVHRQRRDLDGMSDHHLKDIGLNRYDVKQELAKPFWSV